MDAYFLFSGEITKESVSKMIAALNAATEPSRGITLVHFSLCSPGGETKAGIDLYRFLKAFPIPIVVYNEGNVASAAAIAFLGGKVRKAPLTAAFMFHGVVLELKGRWPVHVFEEELRKAKEDEKALVAIIKAELGARAPSDDTLEALPDAEWNLSAEKALSHGVIHDIARFSPPPGTSPTYLM